MLTVKVTTCAPQWPWARQTPSGLLVWEDISFLVDQEVEDCDAWVVFESLPNTQTTRCPSDRTLLITAEPSSIGAYPHEFVDQFSRVMTSRDDLVHPKIICRQQGHPWFIEKNYDELLSLPPPLKHADICLITSDKLFTQGHRDRLRFALDLKARMGGKVDLWGRGIRDFSSSWDLLSNYRYVIVLENLIAQDWLTEKLPDALLAWCVPIYVGCPNLSDYFPTDGLIEINSLDVDAMVRILENLLSDPLSYESRLPAVKQAREHYLNHLQFFANLAPVIREMCSGSESSKSKKTIYSAHDLTQMRSVSRKRVSIIPRIQRFAARALRFPARRMLKLADYINLFPSPPTPILPPSLPVPSLKQVAHASWVCADGDRTLRMDYAIKANEIVLDVGGFEGQWASDIFARYLCTIHVFEPVPQFAKSIRERFESNSNIQVHQAALGNRNDSISISIDGDASSMLLNGEKGINIPLWSCSELIWKNKWDEIALVKINIEGAEYELLEHLIETGLITRIRDIQVQFHDFVPDAHPRMLAIQERLRHTHQLTYYFPFIWENWRRNDS